MLRCGAQVVQAYARNKGIISLRQSYRFSVINLPLSRFLPRKQRKD
nr:MAG TPA_asm: hypothetical protein [Caudoviricetes sp.]